MPLHRVLLTDYAWPDLDMERSILAEACAELIVADQRDAATLARLASEHEVDAIMTNWANVPADVIEASPKCRIVSRLGIGLDNIDVACATRRGIVVTNVPDYCLIEVAEHTLALLLALARKVAWYHMQTKVGHYDLQSGPLLRRIEGQTLGLVGLGNIGRVVAHKAQALGLKVLGTTRTPKQMPPDVEWRTLDQLLSESDFVSLHLPSTPETRHLIGREQLARMKPTAYLINTSRGALVDEMALGEALEQGRLAGAALDVQSQEPPPLAQPPFNDPRVIVTPHAAFASVESLANMRSRAARQVADRLQGRRPENVVNPQVL
jgi:D-3-phosphoglycerate dehydrogenase / 2-oxoglutarate reductase